MSTTTKESALPLISIVTVVYNGEQFIENTLKSVLSQDYPNVEYIVIDGASTDGTLAIIERYKSQLAYFCSKADGGIYDAMNKGIAVATGRWINFMNAGDSFFAENTISEVVRINHENARILFGGVQIQYPDFSRIELPGAPSRLWRGMQFSHQSVFIETDYHKAHLYNVSIRVAADLALMYEAYREGVEFKNLGLVVSTVVTGGVSEAFRSRTIKSSRDAVCGMHFRPVIRTYYFFRLLDSKLRSVVKAILPSALVKKIIMLKS